MIRRLKQMMMANRLKIYAAYTIFLLVFIISSVNELNFWLQIISGACFLVLFSSFVYTEYFLKSDSSIENKKGEP